MDAARFKLPLRVKILAVISIALAITWIIDAVIPSERREIGDATIACIQGATAAQSTNKDDAFCKPNPVAESAPGGKLFVLVMPHERQGDPDSLMLFKPKLADVAVWASARPGDRVAITRQRTPIFGRRLDDYGFGTPRH